MDIDTPATADSRSAHDHASLREDVRVLADEARTFVHAELAYQKTRAAYASGQMKVISLLGAVAAVFSFFAIMAAVVGTVIALGPVLGAWGAMAVVTGVLLLVTLICVFVALHHLQVMKAVLSEGGNDDPKG